jgi:hypothetical protein
MEENVTPEVQEKTLFGQTKKQLFWEIFRFLLVGGDCYHCRLCRILSVSTMAVARAIVRKRRLERPFLDYCNGIWFLRRVGGELDFVCKIRFPRGAK